VHDARPDPWSTVHFEIDPAAFTATADLAA